MLKSTGDRKMISYEILEKKYSKPSGWSFNPDSQRPNTFYISVPFSITFWSNYITLNEQNFDVDKLEKVIIQKLNEFLRTGKIENMNQIHEN